MAVIAYALPILPGQTESARHFAREVFESGFRDRYEALNRQANLRSHREWVQASPSGDLLVVAFETDTPELLARDFDDDDPYDRWWRARVERIHGFDPGSGGALPQLSFEWLAEG